MHHPFALRFLPLYRPYVMFNNQPTCCDPSDGYPVISSASQEHWDWCAGYSMHFDLQKDPFAEANTVVRYERIDCPASLSGCSS